MIAGLSLPPQNTDAEQWVLGAILLNDGVLPDVTEILKPDHLYRDTHQVIYRRILSLHAAGKPVDALILADELERHGELAAVGGIEFVADLANTVPHSANATYHAEIVRQKATARQLAEAYTEGLKEVYSNQFSAPDLLDRGERRILEIADADVKGDTVRLGTVLPEVRASILRREQGEVTGLSSGLADLDDVTTGFQPENLIYLAGRTSMGKTAIALNIIDNLAVNQDRPILLVSLEMSRQEIAERLLVARSLVDGHKVRTGSNLSARDREHLNFADGQLMGAPLFIDDTPGRTASQIVANARRHHAREGIQMVVIDLINHVEGEDRTVSRREQMCVISRRFKQLAREIKVPVMVLAQLNRGPDNREGNRPRKSDLKECGNLEEDADVVLLLHRPEYYDPNDEPGVGVVIVDKNRNGPTRDVRVCFRRNVMRFEDLSNLNVPDYIEPAADF